MPLMPDEEGFCLAYEAKITDAIVAGYTDIVGLLFVLASH